MQRFRPDGNVIVVPARLFHAYPVGSLTQHPDLAVDNCGNKIERDSGISR